jgi:Methylene-tetrahydrofolate reductase C terminal
MNRIPAAFEPAGRAPRDGKRFALRFWAIRNAGGLSRIYDGFEKLIRFSTPLLKRIGLDRLERPVAAVERTVKGALFDCRMCGQCALSSTGLSCPMNCPKSLRNGPCGGVRQNGNCEVYPEMPCVWLKAFEGAQNMTSGMERMNQVQLPVDHRKKGQSSWLAVARGELNRS